MYHLQGELRDEVNYLLSEVTVNTNNSNNIDNNIRGDNSEDDLTKIEIHQLSVITDIKVDDNNNDNVKQ